MEKIVIKKMPSKETLEAFLEGMFGNGSGVVFDTDKGEFIGHKDHLKELQVLTQQ